MTAIAMVEIPGRSRRSPDRLVRVGQVVSLDKGIGIPGCYRVAGIGQGGCGPLLDLVDPRTGALVMQAPAGWVGTVHRGES